MVTKITRRKELFPKHVFKITVYKNRHMSKKPDIGNVS